MNFEKKKLFNEFGEQDYSKRKIIGGNTTNLIELNNIKYEWADKIYRQMMNNFWIPEEVQMGQDIKDYTTLSNYERESYNKIISFLIFLDSLQTSNLPNINNYITAPEISLCLTVQTFQEAVHSQSYSYILDSVCLANERHKIYNYWREDKLLLDRNKFITDQYENFIFNPTIENFIKAVMANYILEGIYFYSGFSFFYLLGKQGKMLGTVSIIKYIQRDENTHLNLFKLIFNELKKESPEIFTNELKKTLVGMMEKAVECEISWGEYVIGDNINGITKDIVSKYIKYLANQRLQALGFDILYKEIKEHPMDWIDSFSNINNIKTDFFEQKVINYSKSSVLDWDSL